MNMNFYGNRWKLNVFYTFQAPGTAARPGSRGGVAGGGIGELSSAIQFMQKDKIHCRSMAISYH